MKNKFLTITNIVLICLVVLLGYMNFSLNQEHSFLQDRINYEFISSFSSLHNNLFNMKYSEETERKISSNISSCKSLFSATSYSDNLELQNIMLALTQMAPYEAEYKLISDRELINDIDYLIINFNLDTKEFEELTVSVWERLSLQLEKCE